MQNFLKNIGVIGLLFLAHLYFYQSEHIKKIDYKFYDFTMMSENKIDREEKSFYTVIVDIDEKSLHELGQWPWPRVIDAQLLNSINEMHPSSIGVNILFPEEDRVSPLYIQKFYQEFFNATVKFREFPEMLMDNDKLLWNALSQSNSTTAIYLSNSHYTSKNCENISYKNNIFKEVETNLIGTSLLCNHEHIQNKIENFGFINAWSDSDGVLRRVPLFMGYKEQIFPSFALATLLRFDNDIEVNSNQDTILVKFSNYKPKVFSAIDILKGKIPSSEIQGKIVIVGSSIVGVDTKYTISTGEKISKNMIHATTIDNILSNSYLTQPNIYKKINLTLSFLLSLLIIFLFSKKHYFYIISLWSISAIISFIALVIFYNRGLYISIGYLWMPLIYFSSALLIYHIRVINKEKEQQEKFLVKQSKLASMGEMITLIAHQWRQPLSAINGIVLNMDIDQRKGILDEDKLDDHLNQIESTTAYLSKTINDFTDFFSKNKKRDTFYIEGLINQVKQLTGVVNQKNFSIIHENRKNINFTGYKSELIQSLLIVLNNAIYACQKNNGLTVLSKITINSSFSNEKLCLTIKDNGGGIDEKVMKQIFNPYFTTKDAQHGTGLGLYILKMIVEDSMNGKVFVENGEEGAIFTIIVPTIKE